FPAEKPLGCCGDLPRVMALPPPPNFDTSAGALSAIQIQRYKQAVRWTMFLSLTDLISKIS
ncbi:MltR family transcriptional regulator, partial [Salmonella enterica subsp. enterica serovar Heidelberg]